MYKILTSFWSKSSAPTNPSKRSSLENATTIDEDDWVLISPTSKRISATEQSSSSPTMIKTEQAANVQHFNPIENLLIEHASMSVYDQIAFQTRHRRQRKVLEEETDNDEEEEDNNNNNGQSSIVFQFQSEHSNAISVDQPNLSVSMEQNRPSHRVHQRRKRSLKSSNLEKTNQLFDKILERQRLNSSARTLKFLLHQPSRSNH